MSESSAFANYSNISKSLQQTSGQQQAGVSTTDKINDAANFEQQFLIGMAVHQKAKVGDQVAKLFKGSKKLQKATGLSEEEIGNITKGDFSGITKNIANATSRKLQQGVRQIRNLKNQNLSDLADLKAKQTAARMKKNVSDLIKKDKGDADDAVRDAKQASDSADAEVERLAGQTVEDNTADLDAAAKSARAAADAGVDDNVSDLEKTAGALRRTAKGDKVASDIAKKTADETLPTRPTSDSTPDDVRLEPNPAYDEASETARNARKVSDESDARATDAEQQVNDARQSSQDAQSALEDNAQRAEAAANEARASTENAQNALSAQQAEAGRVANNAKATLTDKTATAEELAESSADAEAEAAASRQAASVGESAAEKSAADLENVTSTVKKVAGVAGKIDKVDEGIAATSEFDPLALVVAGIGAIASAVIGRRVKTHDAVTTSIPQIQSSYAATVGA